MLVVQRLSAITFLLFAGFVSVSEAADGEAAKYVEQCRAAVSMNPENASWQQWLDAGFCFGLMDGVRGSNYYVKTLAPDKGFCEPPTALNDDLAKVFVATVDKNPELKKLRGSLAAVAALTTAYPCKATK